MMTGTQSHLLRRRISPPSATFFSIIYAPVRVGEDEPLPSWDPVPNPYSERIYFYFFIHSLIIFHVLCLDHSLAYVAFSLYRSLSCLY